MLLCRFINYSPFGIRSLDYFYSDHFGFLALSFGASQCISVKKLKKLALHPYGLNRSISVIVLKYLCNVTETIIGPKVIRTFEIGEIFIGVSSILFFQKLLIFGINNDPETSQILTIGKTCV